MRKGGMSVTSYNKTWMSLSIFEAVLDLQFKG
jgi:hypothetical protein